MRGNSQRVFIIVIVVVFFLTSLATSGLLLLSSFNKDKSAQTNSAQEEAKKNIEAQLQQQQAAQAGGTLEKTDLTVGTGAEAVTGKNVTVHYTGTLTNGTKFDSSLDRGEPFSFVVGEGRVIQGWEQGVQGMKVGGKRKLVIPPELGYKDQAAGSIPPNSTLVFEIELLKVE